MDLEHTHVAAKRKQHVKRIKNTQFMKHMNLLMDAAFLLEGCRLVEASHGPKDVGLLLYYVERSRTYFWAFFTCLSMKGPEKSTLYAWQCHRTANNLHIPEATFGGSNG